MPKTFAQTLAVNAVAIAFPSMDNMPEGAVRISSWHDKVACACDAPYFVCGGCVDSRYKYMAIPCPVDAISQPATSATKPMELKIVVCR